MKKRITQKLNTNNPKGFHIELYVGVSSIHQ